MFAVGCATAGRAGAVLALAFALAFLRGVGADRVEDGPAASDDEVAVAGEPVPPRDTVTATPEPRQE